MGRNKNNKGRNPKGKHISIDIEEPDFDTMDLKELSRYKKRKSKKSKRRKEQAAKEEPDYSLPWCKVETRCKTPIKKAFLFESVGSYIGDFVFYGFRTLVNNSAIFYLEKPGKMDGLTSLSNRLQNEDNQPMTFRVTYMQIPDVAVNSVQMETIKQVLQKRFTPSALLLDLTAFHKDSILRENEIFAPLSSNLVAKVVSKLCMGFPKGIKALNLSENYLSCSSLSHWQDLVQDLAIHALCLDNNDIKGVESLSRISSPYLKELSVLGNEITKPLGPILEEHFPNVNRNGENTEPGHINEAMVNTYLKTYYDVLDSSDRSALVYAYTEDITLQLISTNPAIPSGTCSNLEEIKHFLQNFPATVHPQDIMKMNIIESSPEKFAVDIAGVFSIAGAPAPLQFSNKMMLHPRNAGICCSQQLLEIK